ncbi:MAG: asparagine synthase-related protein [Acidobacteriota bacterium]
MSKPAPTSLAQRHGIAIPSPTDAAGDSPSAPPEVRSAAAPQEVLRHASDPFAQAPSIRRRALALVLHRANALASGPRAVTDELAAMLHALGGGHRSFQRRHRKQAIWRDGRLAAGQVFPRGTAEGHPHPAEDRAAIVLWQGRVDNRRELAAALDLQNDAAIGDLLLAAYHRWQETFLDHLLGPLAVVLWDRRRHRLLLARDPLGGRNLFFHPTDERTLVASEEIALLLHPHVAANPDPDRLAQLFALAEPDGRRTFFRGIEQVAAGEVRAFTAHGPAAGRRIHRFWPFEARPRLLRGSADERAERYREVLAEAVRCRLAANSRTAISLRGGLDSTAIAALAAEASRRSLLAATWAFDQYPGCDERQYLPALVADPRIELLPVSCDRAGPPKGPLDLGSWPLHPATPEQNPYRRFHQRTYRAVADKGARVLLSGMLGDQLWSGGERWLWEQLREGRLRTAGASLAAHLQPAPGLSLGTHLSNSARPLARALLPPRWAARWRPPSPPPWALYRATTPWPPSGRRARRPTQFAALLGAGPGHGFGVERWFAARHGLEVRYPYRDRRLIELVLRLPVEDLRGGELSRPLHRRALRHHLPAAILERPGKTSFAPLFWRSLEGDRLDRLLERFGDASEPWLDRSWLDRARRRRDPADAVGLWLAVSFGWWWETALTSLRRAKGMVRRR